MSEYEVNVKVNIDSTEVDETIEKFKQLAEAHELRRSQLAKEFEEMDARVKDRLNRIQY